MIKKMRFGLKTYTREEYNRLKACKPAEYEYDVFNDYETAEMQLAINERLGMVCFIVEDIDDKDTSDNLREND